MTRPSVLPNSNPLIAVAMATALWFAGCSPKPIPPPSAPHPNNAPSGTITWPSWAEDNPLPGVDHASAYGCWDDNIVYVIWADFDTSSGGTSGPTMAGIYSASLTAERGTQVECECKTKDGVSGTLEIRVDRKLISDVPYDLEKGRVFLIRTRGAAPKVTQLSRTVFDSPVENAKEDVKSRLQELAINDIQVKEFLTNGSDGKDSTNRP